MTVWLSNPQRMASEAVAEAFAPPPPVDYLGWAEENIVFSARESPFPGPYNRALFVYFDEILVALGPDDPCRTVTLMKSAQLGGTVLANIFVGGSLIMDPGDVLYVHPTDDNARRWSKMKLTPMIRGTPALRSAIPERSRDGSDSVMYKERADGRGALQISGANSPASLSQVSMKRQVQDDLSKWEMNAAGDPETQANSRSRGFEFAKIFKISTPLVEPGCRITKAFKSGSQEYPFVPCPHCGEMQVLEWENMLAHLDPERPERACFHCDACGAAIEEHHRAQMLRGLEWRASNPAALREHRSFWIWSAYSLLQSWERLAREWLDAKGDAAAEQTFTNDSIGRAYQALGEAPAWEVLRDRADASRYACGQIPTGALVLTIGVDVQGDRVEWQLVGWGRDLRRYVIDYGVIPGFVTDASCMEALDGLTAQTWPNAFGRRFGADLIAIDGNAYTEDVWLWVRRHPASKVIMVRGRHEEHLPLLAAVKRERNRQGKLLKYSRRFYNVGTATMKMGLYRNVAKIDEAERGFVGFPRGLEDEYFRMLTSERRTPQKRRDGFVEYRWMKDPKQANEGLDTMIQAEAAAVKLGLRGLPDAVWDRFEAEREVPAPALQFDFEDMPLSRPEPAAIPAPRVAEPVDDETLEPPAPPVQPRPAVRRSAASRLNR